jgi:class 3 adenylate cyclase
LAHHAQEYPLAKSPIRRRVFRAIVLSAVGAGSVLAVCEPALDHDIKSHAQTLASIAAEAGAGIDAERHKQIVESADADGPAFLALRDVLRGVQKAHDIVSPVYTLRPVGGGQTEFVVMTNPTPFIGHSYERRSEMDAVFERGERGTTGLYGDDHGWWVSGYAAVVTQDGRVEALVSVDRPSEDFAAQRLRNRLLALLAAILLGGLEGLANIRRVRKMGPARVLRRLLTGSLATRIGLAGAVAVLMAVGVVSALDHGAARTELLTHCKEELQATTKLGALIVDVDLQREVAMTGDEKSPAFLALREQLRGVRSAAGLSSPVYTLQRDGTLARFVGMTNEKPFVGDAIELRSGVQATFEGSDGGTEGPYTDAHGTWISGWAPLLAADGRVEGVIQADHEVGAAMMMLWNRTLQRLLFALVGVGVAFLAAVGLARGIARPVRQVADAARRVGAGDLDVDVPSDRLDEVGDLARAVEEMAAGLRERERMRDMFGKYMATQVVQDLLDNGGLSLAGELREVSVVITDIRGYTALTEQLGAAEVVALLNEYFSILVDVVIKQHGVIDKFMGDALLCWFGAPVPQEDHAERAVAAAESMLRRTSVWNADRVAKGLPAVPTGIGIATGRVVVGNIGSPQRLEYTAIGDAVNLASRLCGKAGGGEILFSDEVGKAVPGHGYEALPPMQVKGVAAPVKAYRRLIPIVG